MFIKKTKLGKFNLVIIAIFVLSAIGLKIWQYRWPTELIMLKDEPLLAQIARTPYHHKKGLGGRESMGKFDGMLFIFTFPGRVGIVMRDMEFPIDIVWLSNGEVVDIMPNAPIEPDASEENLTRYYPRKDANLVLELRAGWAEEHGLKIGDVLTVLEE